MHFGGFIQGTAILRNFSLIGGTKHENGKNCLLILYFTVIPFFFCLLLTYSQFAFAMVEHSLPSLLQKSLY